ncbi:hypothetical protein KUF54_01915 [Comamonas sp. Y33R10-2]|uniref:hypothetical protein n=1 Tax=Comamonas sp. Y33R10-2 TaxID=2853257 RepID=UPI001C5C88F4|nr:hypothetical protein [Comamonas sp. Y33R10-2]QXZ10048.1 hypothetical protein KUF54_01915 [Comamonas sp. Y33R10-2]
MRAAPLLLVLSLATGSVLAQTPSSTPAATVAAPAPAPAPASAPAPQGQQDNSAAGGKHNQRIEQIRVEDGGSRVDETRVGGQTQSITVQPKVGTMPEYEVQSNDGARAARNRDTNSSDTTGTRVWNFLKF